MKQEYTKQEIRMLYYHLVVETQKFFSKAGFSKAVIGLSGGIDSALVAAITCEAIGHENVLGISMPSKYSSDHSIEDARKLAENFGMEFEIVPILGTCQAFDNLFAGTIDDDVNDFTFQNIQARVRMIILHVFANRQRRLVMNTCNLTEDLVGYSTLYGDSAGALAPLGNIGKMMVYELAKERNSFSEVIPQSSIDKAPSAELAPGQTDEGSLGIPYSVLDPLTRVIKSMDYHNERALVRFVKGFHREFKEEDILKVRALMKSNAFKLLQAPPSIDVSCVYE